MPFERTRFADKPTTQYAYGVENVCAHEPLASTKLDGIKPHMITSFVESKRKSGLAVTSINRQLEVLRRMFNLAMECGAVSTALPKVKLLSGERRRDRVISHDEKVAYLAACGVLLGQVASILIDCALRPEECFRLRWDQIRDGALHITYGKTENRVALDPDERASRRDHRATATKRDLPVRVSGPRRSRASGKV